MVIYYIDVRNYNQSVSAKIEVKLRLTGISNLLSLTVFFPKIINYFGVLDVFRI